MLTWEVFLKIHTWSVNQRSISDWKSKGEMSIHDGNESVWSSFKAKQKCQSVYNFSFLFVALLELDNSSRVTWKYFVWPNILGRRCYNHSQR